LALGADGGEGGVDLLNRGHAGQFAEGGIEKRPPTEIAGARLPRLQLRG